MPTDFVAGTMHTDCLTILEVKSPSCFTGWKGRYQVGSTGFCNRRPEKNVTFSSVLSHLPALASSPGLSPQIQQLSVFSPSPTSASFLSSLLDFDSWDFIGPSQISGIAHLMNLNVGMGVEFR